MTKPAFRRVAVFVGTAALATGSGIGVAAQGDESNRSSTPRVTNQQTGDPDETAAARPDETAVARRDESPRAGDEV
jgi:hypothetical protein